MRKAPPKPSPRENPHLEDILHHLVGPSGGGHAVRIGTTICPSNTDFATIDGFAEAVAGAKSRRIEAEIQMFTEASPHVNRHLAPNDVRAGIHEMLSHENTREPMLDIIFQQLEKDVVGKRDAFFDRYDAPEVRERLKTSLRDDWAAEEKARQQSAAEGHGHAG